MRKTKQPAPASLLKSAAFRLVLVSLLVVVSAYITLVAISGTNRDSSATIVRYGGNGPKTGTYEVIGTKKDGQTLRVSVVIKPLSEDELIVLNDQLYKEYKDRAPSIFIDYFDDKSAATDYFVQVSKSVTSDEQKKELVSHYKAVMVATEQLQKKLFLIGSEPRLLKSY